MSQIPWKNTKLCTYLIVLYFHIQKKLQLLLAFLSFAPSCNAVRHLVMNDILITTCALLISGDFLTPTLYIGYVLLYAYVYVYACSYASLAISCQSIKQRTVRMQQCYEHSCGTFESSHFHPERPQGFFHVVKRHSSRNGTTDIGYLTRRVLILQLRVPRRQAGCLLNCPRRHRKLWSPLWSSF